MEENNEFRAVVEHVRQTALLETAQAVLEWDERTGLPPRAGEYRAEQITCLAGLIHARRTDSRLGDLLEQLAAQLDPTDTSPVAASVRKLHKDFQRHTRLPIDLVQAISKATVLGQQAWQLARAENDWPAFAPHLKEIFRLRREEAERLADGRPLYDSLLDQYEPGAKSAELWPVFNDLRERLVPLVQQLTAAPRRPDGASLRRPVPIAIQRPIARWVTECIGFDYQRGRLDETAHPFCTTLGPHDCRILTRFQENFFATGFYGALHEAGHGIYEQGLPTDWFGLPAGTYCSLGVHESQSRLWENLVGRSRAFWEFAFAPLAKRIGAAWEGLSPEILFRDANLVQPSLIRVEADEVTYNLHILIRFELEQGMLEGSIAIEDAPAAWADRYEKYLGIRPTDYTDGILQDVHWSAGLIGYFPTYTLGNLYAAQLFARATTDLGDLDHAWQRGEFQPLLQWLREQVHQWGACLDPPQLMERAVGTPLSAQPLDDYLRTKLLPLYA